MQDYRAMHDLDYLRNHFRCFSATPIQWQWHEPLRFGGVCSQVDAAGFCQSAKIVSIHCHSCPSGGFG